GAITVAGTFSPGAAAGHTTTGSTVSFNGAGAQTIPAFSYNNLTSSGAGARTLAASGVIKIAGSFTPGSNPYTITGSTIEYSSGASAISSGRSVNRYWTLGNGGTVFDQCSVVLTFVAADVDAGASTGNFMVQNYNAPEWTTPTTGTRTATSIQATGLTTLGDF